MFPRHSLSLAAALLALAASAVAQDANEQARRLLETGRSYYKEGRFKQALDSFNIIVTSFPESDSIGQALLEIGRYRMEGERDLDKARASFEQVTKQYAQSDGAPGAYYYLGLMALGRAVSADELADALAQLGRVQTLYPRSEWVPRALQASALVHRKAGRYLDAVDVSRRVSLEYPNSDAAAPAQFQVGHALALLGEPRQAMEEFQQVRNRFPDSPWAERALERVTALYRLYGEGKPVFRPDPSFAAGSGDLLRDVRALLMAREGTLWIASNRVKSAVPVAPGGKLGPGLPAEDLRSLALDPHGRIVVAARTAVRFGPTDVKSFAIPSENVIPEPLDRILAAAVTPGGKILVSDERRKRVFRFDAQFEHRGTFPERDAVEREVTRMLVDEEGRIVMLDRRAKTVQFYDESGRLLRTVGPAGLRRPADAEVDPFGNTYVADEDGSVQVFDTQGRLLTSIGGEELRRPKALTLDATSAVLVWDDRSNRILRYH